LVLTDADCMPSSENWLSKIVESYLQETQIVIGYGAYIKESGFLNKLIRFDCFYNAIQYLSYGLAGMPYMGVGRNLSYKKDFFFNNKGFANHYHIQAGEDDLFVNEFGTGENSKVVLNAEAHTLTEAKKTFKDWKVQKQRHLSTSKYYKWKHKFLLGVFNLNNYFLLLLFILLLLFKVMLIPTLVAYSILFLSKYIVYFKASKKLNETDLWIFSFIFELIFLVVYPFLQFNNLFIKKHRWK
jgi:hypothetical protein